MKDFSPILATDPESPEARLLRSARLDEPKAGSKHSVLAGVAAASAVATATTCAAAASSPPAVALATTKMIALAKMVAVVALAAGAAVGAARVVEMQRRLPSRIVPQPSPSMTPRWTLASQTPPMVVAPVLQAPDAGNDKLVEPPQIGGQTASPSVAKPDSSTRLAPDDEPTKPVSPFSREVRPSSKAPEPENPPLVTELVTISQVRRKLATGDAPAALRMLDEYERLVRPQLEPEAMALRVEALVGLGRVAEARTVANRLLSNDSGRAYAKRVLSLLKQEVSEP